MTARAPRNRTLTLTSRDRLYRANLLTLHSPAMLPDVLNKTIYQEFFSACAFLPDAFADLLVLDPPYNLTKQFGTTAFKAMSNEAYEVLLDSWLSALERLLKPNASIYVCGDWRSASAIQRALERRFMVRNRLTWEREKGRGAKQNWKNCAEDIWFATVSDNYTFNINAVKLRRRVLAPYRRHGAPKDWTESDEGNFRDTHPSNIWTDISVPFWSMPENTRHPTQKPEKLLAKLILASSNENDVVLDPFLGSGTTSVVAKKLGRRFVGIDIDEQHCLMAEKRLALAEMDKSIQGFSDGVFWERNSLGEQKKSRRLSRQRISIK